MASSNTKINFNFNTLKPTPGHLLVKPAEADKQTVSGIYLPDSHEEAPLYGVVVAVGDDLITNTGTIKSPAKVSDVVVYKKWGGNEFMIENINHQFLKFEDILAVSTSEQKKGRGRPKKNK